MYEYTQRVGYIQFGVELLQRDDTETECYDQLAIVSRVDEEPIGPFVREWATRNLFQARSCHHPHDCCGHWYPSEGVVVGELNECSFIVKQSFLRNI